jgi:NAD+ kinase
MKNITDIGLILNTDKEKSFKVAADVMEWLNERNITVRVEKMAAEKMGLKKENSSFPEMKSSVDLVILFGGDGTFLYTAQHFIGTEIPILGVNLGRLGFLTEIEIEELYQRLSKIIKGDFSIKKRMLLQSQVKRCSQLVHKSFALNDVVVNRGANSRMINIKLYINEEFVNSYRADGLIMATPTGSTAYNLSAGGPIVNPQIRAIIITPICPHTLYVRPMVISENEKLKIVITGKNNVMKITTDGNKTYDLNDEDHIYISAAKNSISMVNFADKTFYNILHEKMRVGLV